MSERTDHPLRRGVALLVALAVSAVAGVCVLALWRTAAAADRANTLELATVAVESTADSARAAAFGLLATGAWRNVPQPGDTVTLASGIARRGTWRTTLARVGWKSLLVGAVASRRSGVPSVAAHADRRTLIPLQTPFPLPSAAITGANRWSVDPAARVEVPAPIGPELGCRLSGVPAASAQAAFPSGFDPRGYPAVDPDTVRDSLVGVFRLTRRQLTRPLTVEGMLVLDSELVVGADLRLTGVLVARGSILTAGGRLTVTGAVITGDVGGGHSGLGAGDWVRYDACAIRRAVERVTRLGPASTWTHLSLF